MKFLKRRREIGIGIGIGVAGALAIGLRYGLRRSVRPAIPEDASPAIFARRLSTTSHGDMVYHISGSGSPVVFLHGIYPGASSYEWSRVYPSLVLEHEVVATDLIGFGESERPDHPMDAADYAESLADFLFEVCAGRQPAVVASGRTCPLLLLMASRHPERLGSLILLDPRIRGRRAPWASFGLAMAARVPGLGPLLYRTCLAREPFLASWAARFGYAEGDKVDADTVRHLTVYAQQSGAGHASLRDLRGGFGVNLQSRLERIPHPVTLIYPENSPSSACTVLESALPDARVVSFPPSGVLAALEHPLATIEALRCVLPGNAFFNGVA